MKTQKIYCNTKQYNLMSQRLEITIIENKKLNIGINTKI